MIFDSRQLRPTYRFTQGVPGRSHALEIGVGAGLPTLLLERAKQLIDDDQVDIQAAIVLLQKRHKELEKQKKKLRRDELRLHRRIQETKKEEVHYKELQEKYREKARVRLAKEVDKAERELRALLNEISSQKQKRSGLAKMVKARKDILEPFSEEPKKLDGPDLDISGAAPEAWNPGDSVYLKTWLREGTLVKMERKKARVNCKGKIFTVNLKDLVHLKQAKPAKAEVSDSLESAAEEPASFELRLLGWGVEEAILELEHRLDLALRQNLPFLRIIHGHGTGALKTAVRSYLKQHLAKDSFRVETNLSNDGVTELIFERN